MQPKGREGGIERLLAMMADYYAGREGDAERGWRLPADADRKGARTIGRGAGNSEVGLDGVGVAGFSWVEVVFLFEELVWVVGEGCG